jgi:thioredoxin 1
MFSNFFGRGTKKGRNAAAAETAHPPRPLPIDVTDATFGELIAGAPQLAVVDFWAEWCAPCTTMSAYVGFLAADFAGRLTVAALDVDENPDTSARYGVMALPTLLFLLGGEEVGRIVGLAPYSEIKRQAEQLLAEHATNMKSESEPHSPGNTGEVPDASL